MFIPLANSELETFLNRYENYNTKAQYKNSIRKFHSFLITKQIYSLDSVSLEVGELFKHDLEDFYSPKTAQITLDAVKEFFKYLQARGFVGRNEMALVKSTKVSSREHKTSYVTDVEFKRMLQVAYARNDYYSLSNRVMLIISFNIGLRESELANLKLSDFTLQSGYYVIKVLGKGMRNRYLTFSKAVTFELSKLFNQLALKGNDYIIQGKDRAGNYKRDKPISRMTIFNRVRAISIEAKIDKDISPHSLRRGTATHLYKIGTPIAAIQRILGHNSPMVTSRYIASEIDKEISAKYSLEIVSEAF